MKTSKSTLMESSSNIEGRNGNSLSLMKQPILDILNKPILDPLLIPKLTLHNHVWIPNSIVGISVVRSRQKKRLLIPCQMIVEVAIHWSFCVGRHLRQVNALIIILGAALRSLQRRRWIADTTIMDS